MIVSIVLTFVLSMLGSYFLVKHREQIALFAFVNERSVHKEKTPNSGGIAIVGSFLLFLLFSPLPINFAIIFSVIFLFLFGLYDDKFGASSKEKILFIFFISNILYFNGFYISYLGNFLGNEIYISGFFAYSLLCFALIGFINSVNLIDGLDGLASLVGIVILSSFLYMGLKFDDTFLIAVSAAYIAALGGFLIFNYPPAKIFMGDSGSLTLGLVIALVAIYAINQHYISVVTSLLLAALPILDTFVVMTRRVFSGKNPFVADKLHIHHIIHKQQGYNTKKTLFILVLMQGIFTYVALGFKIRDDILVIILFFMLYLLAYFLLATSKNMK
jgi:UDP-GlcNAc:undecaprenyl-phosphate GlcNAc-1-phosphate transferase